MNSEVVVVGAGIGGLTVAALLAQRGVKVSVLERESFVGGCVANFEKFGYSFEPGYGLYTGWGASEIHDRIFSELSVEAPEVRLLNPSYAVQLADQSEIALLSNIAEFEENLTRVFPECAHKAISFYRHLSLAGSTLRDSLRRMPDFFTAGASRRAFSMISEPRKATRILKSSRDSASDHLDGVSSRFRNFVDAQLHAFAQAGSKDVPYLHAAMVLSAPLAGMWAIRGGAAALATTLAESIKRSGGKVRLNAPVLRLSYDAGGNATGVDLLTGETVTASRAIISNLTIWDTYGKLVGLNRTPPEVRQRLKLLRSWGAYLVYLGVNESAIASLPASQLMALTEWHDDAPYNPEDQQLFVAAAPEWDARAPEGKRAVTVHAFTDVESWFTFHRDETEHEEKDQAMLENVWQRLHRSVPDLLTEAEVIETVTPRAFYESTRRKLGMVGGLPPNAKPFWTASSPFVIPVPNVFIISDTTCPGGIAGLSNSAWNLAASLTR